eukprot:4479796-Amphidinium_carterae.1
MPHSQWHYPTLDTFSECLACQVSASCHQLAPDLLTSYLSRRSRMGSTCGARVTKDPRERWDGEDTIAKDCCDAI